MQEYGLPIGSANLKVGKYNIYEVFADSVAHMYHTIGQDSFPKKRSGTCGLCGHTGLSDYYIVSNSTGKDAVTVHTDYGMEFVWPTQFHVGTSCIDLLNIDYDNCKLFDSMFKEGSHFTYEVTPNGNIYPGFYLVRYYKDWVSDVLVVPHALFTIFPKQIMREVGLEVYTLNNRVDVSSCSESKLLNSYWACSNKAKYKPVSRVTDIVIEGKKDGSDESLPYLATIITKQQAQRILELHPNLTYKK